MARSYEMPDENGKAQKAHLLEDMIHEVEQYLMLRTGRIIKIKTPENQRQLNLLGKAHDHVKKFSPFASGGFSFGDGEFSFNF